MLWTNTGLLSYCLCLIPVLVASADQNAIGGDRHSNVPWPPPPEDQLDRYIHWLMEGYNVPGLSLAIIDDGKIAAKGYGYARLPSTPATADTLWFTGSTTKAFVAAAAAHMIADEHQYPDLKWTSRIHDYMPADFVVDDHYVTRHLTVEDALSHRTGMPAHDKAYGWGNQTLLDFVRSMRYLPLTADFRSVFQYCNVMVMAVSKMLEVITTEPIVDLVRRLLWRPIGMSSTFFFPAEFVHVNQTDVRERLARGYYWVEERFGGDEGAHYVPEPYLDLTVVSGAGATVSSVNDYALWVRTLLQADPYSWTPPLNKSSPITRSMYSDLTAPRMAIFDDDVSGIAYNDHRRPDEYALGWITSSFAGHTVVSHGGSLTGFGTRIWMIPDQKIGVVTIANTQDSEIAASLLAIAVFRARVKGRTTETLETAGTARSRNAHDLVAGSIEFEDDQYLSRQKVDTWYEEHTNVFETVDAFVGLYRHAAYGTLEITSAQRSAPFLYQHVHAADRNRSTSEYPDLIVKPSKRTWPFILYLQHDAGSWFQSIEWKPHGNYANDPVPGLHTGCDGPPCINETMWESEGQSPEFVHFMFGPRPIGEGPRFQQATRFGIHLSSGTESAARGYGGLEAWERSVLWFDRVV